MKKLLFLLSFGFFFFGLQHEATASHAAGGEITYRYIGDSTGIPYNYCITLTVYRRNESGSAGLGNTFTVNISSSCFSNQTVTVTRQAPFDPAGDGGNNVPNYTPCINPSDPALYQISQHIYKACVVLPGKCSDFRFWWSLCCRNSNITNLVNPSSASLYLESKLNNTKGYNTSPAFVNPAAKSFCTQTQSPFVWSQNAVEPDQDSLRFTLQQPWSAQNSPIAWASGYSTQQPMTTLNGFNINQRNGTFFFQPTQQENDVLKIVVEEYRYDATFQIWYLVGTAIRELQVPVVTQCNPIATAGISIDSTVTGPNGQPAGTALYSVDSLKQIFGITKVGNPTTAGGTMTRLPVVPYKCFDSIVTIEFDKGLVCDSFSVDGSEFRIIGPDNVLRPVTGVRTNCGSDLLTRKVDLLLHKSLDTTGDFLLYIKTGNDGNSLMNECGFPVDSFFAIIIRVDQCPYPVYKLNNVSVSRDQDIDIDWEIDINSFEPSVFTAWNILRANENDQYYILTSLNDPGAVNARSFKDTTLEPIDVDLSQYQYRVQLVQNGKAYPTTNRIFSILLKDTLNSTEDGNIYSWTVYNGWDSAAYELEYGEFDTILQQMVFQNFGGPQQNYFEDEFFYPSCDENRDTTGLYAFRVIATDPNNPNNNFKSESNWLYYKIDCQAPPEKIIDTTFIPTVFSPNGDGRNDVFTIKTNFQNANVSIFNRWGKPVFTSDGQVDQLVWNGTDQASGQKVADGVYYYIIKLNGSFDDGQGGQESRSEEFTGSLTIFTSGTR